MDFSLGLYFCFIKVGKFLCIRWSYVNVMRFLREGDNFWLVFGSVLLWLMFFLCCSRLFLIKVVSFWNNFFGFFFEFKWMLLKFILNFKGCESWFGVNMLFIFWWKFLYILLVIYKICFVFFLNKLNISNKWL